MNLGGNYKRNHWLKYSPEGLGSVEGAAGTEVVNVLGTHGEELDVRMIWLLFSMEEEAERDAGNNVMTGCLVEAYSRYKRTVTSLRDLYLNRKHSEDDMMDH